MGTLSEPAETDSDRRSATQTRQELATGGSAPPVSASPTFDAMASLQRSAAFRRLVGAFVAEAHAHGWRVSESGAAQLLEQHVERAALALGIEPATLIRTYLPEDRVREMARDCIPEAAASGATGRFDEPPVPVPRSLVGPLITNLGQAARFAATHRTDVPDAGLHNLVADALTILGEAVGESFSDPILVPGYGLRLARRAFHLVADGIHAGWILELREPDGTVTLAELTDRLGAAMEQLVNELDQLLPPLPPPTPL